MRNGGRSGDEGSKKRPLKVLEMALRVCVIPLSLASLLEMATNKQADETYGKVDFTNLSGFKYLVCINAITIAYSLASILLSSLKSFTHCDWLLFILDQVVAYLLVTSGAAAGEVVYLAEEGDREVSWGEVCSYFGSFCGKSIVSLALHAMALLCFMALALISAHRVFSKYQPPLAPHSGLASSKQVEEQGAVQQ